MRTQPALTHQQLLARISADPSVCFGKPCIRGSRVWVSRVLNLLASGETVEGVLAEYQGIHAEDVRACIAWAAEITRERFVDSRLAAA